MRTALVVAVNLPMSALMTFIVMNYFGMSANLMSLGGLAIAIGMLVDGSVVVVENTVTQLQQSSRSLPRMHVIFRAIKEVMVPIISGTLIILLVFSPLVTLQGLEGKLFAPGGDDHYVCHGQFAAGVTDADPGAQLAADQREKSVHTALDYSPAELLQP